MEKKTADTKAAEKKTSTESVYDAVSYTHLIMDAFAADFAFDLNTPSVLSWINERGAEFVTSVTDEQKRCLLYTSRCV